MRAAIERDGERARLARALDRAVGREGALVLIEGPAGIGRSTELEATRRAARERGMTVLAARASELEQTYPFGVVRQLFERELLSASADRRAELLADAAVLAAPALGLDGRPPSAVDAPFSILHGLHWLAAGFQPVLLAVDDAHWADRASLRALLYLTARLEGQAIAIVMTVRSGETTPLLDELAVAASDVVRLGPLSRAGVAAFLADRTGEPRRAGARRGRRARHRRRPVPARGARPRRPRVSRRRGAARLAHAHRLRARAAPAAARGGDGRRVRGHDPRRPR